MAIQNKDYFTFLGGEVSPNLFKRVDMRAANKWFETAKNIFFSTTGGFFNRVGTEVVDNTYSAGQKVRLLKFVYNKSQSYEVVFSQSNIKIYDNKTLLSTVSHNLQLSSDLDIIYTQIGDVMYICLGNTTKIYTLKRYANDNWVFDEFKYNIPPMLDLNTDKTKKITFEKNTTYVPSLTVNVSFKTLTSFSNVTVEYKDSDNEYNTIYTSQDTFSDKSSFITAFNTGKTEGTDIYAYYINNETVRFGIPQSLADDVMSIKITADGIYNEYSSSGYYTQDNGGMTSYIDINSDDYISYCKIKVQNFANTPFITTSNYLTLIASEHYNDYYFFEQTFDTPLSITDFINVIHTSLPCVPGKSVNTYSWYDSVNQRISTRLNRVRNDYGQIAGGMGLFFIAANGNNGLLKILKKENNISVEQNVDSSESLGLYYNIGTPAGFLDDKNIGDIFCIESVYTPSFDGTAGENETVAVTNFGAGTGYLPSSEGFWSNGSWRLVTSGLMDGTLELEYSYDGVDWYSHRSFTSGIKTVSGVSSSTLYNEYGTLDVDDNVKLRLKYDLTGSTSMGITFDTDSFENRSYYKILEKTSDYSAIVECIKYPIGTPAETYQWAESAWSDTEGYPAICFTYQNRLCFAKTNNNPFTVWTSRTNDYTDFATKIKYQDDDPITMDVVKFNGISNIATVAALNKLFVFTEDAEFGIQDQGALTQANKSLVSFSKYGAEPIETQVSGNRILFVENGGKAARQLFYDFAQENYEAPDVTVLYKHLLKDEKIIATDYIGLDYRTYLMLTSSGRVICYKYIPEQEITACSWFKHAKGTITNISALDVGNNTVRIYMAVDIGSRKQIEIMDLSNENYLDSRHSFDVASGVTTVDVSSYYDNGDELVYFYNGVKQIGTVTEGNITLPEATTEAISITFGYAYESEATLIPINILARNGSSIYNKKNVFKANFEYFDSVGFKVGMKDYQNEFEEIKYLEGPIGTENTPHSGEKDDILLDSSYLSKNMLSFKQAEPYKMNITNLQIEVDYGG